MKTFANVVLLSFIWGLVGCSVDIVEPEPSNHPSLGVEVTSEVGKKMADIHSINADARLEYNAGKSYRSTQLVSAAAHASAFFTNDTEGADVSLVKIFDVPLIRGGKGQYHLLGIDTSKKHDKLYWFVEGYDGGAINDVSTNVREMSVEGIEVGDTVSRSEGFTVNYTGAAGGDLDIVLTFDYTHTHAWGDSALADTEDTGGFLNKRIIDNGQIHFTPEELESFTAGVYVSLSFSHWVYHITQSSAGRPVEVYRSYSVNIPLFLKP